MLDTPARPTLAGPAVRRSLWVVLDQGLASLTNFAVTLVVARSVDAAAFGAFGVAFVIYLVGLGLVRALVSQPLTIRSSARPDPQREVAAAAGAAAAVGIVLGLAVMGAGAVAGGPPGRLLVVLAAFLPALMLQDTWRWAFFTTAEPRKAVANDLVCALAQAVLIGTVLVFATPTACTLTAAWGGAAVVAAGLGAHQARAWPAGPASWAFLRRHGDLGGRLGAEFLLQTGSTQLATLALAPVIGAAGVGAIRGAQTLFGPLSIVLQGLAAACVPEGSRLLARRPARLRPLLRATSAGLAVAALGWGVALVWLPGTWGASLLGDTWPAARSLAVPLTVLMAGLGVAAGGIIGLRVLAAASASLRLRLVTGPASLAIGVVGGLLGGVRGGAWGLAVAEWITGVGAWWALGSHLRSRGQLPWRREPASTSPRHGPAMGGEAVHATGRSRWIYIAGQDRSGSTLLGMLAARAAGGFYCGELYRLPEALVAGHLCQCGVEVGRCEVWAAVAGRIRALTGLRTDQEMLEVMRDRLRRRHLLAPRMPRARPAELALRQATERAVEEVTRAAWVVDSSKFSSQLWTAAHLDRPLTVVHLVRDPRAVAFSQSRPKYDPSSRATWVPRPTWQSALTWLRGQVTTERVVRHIEAEAMASAVVTLRYEDLVTDPASALGRFVGDVPAGIAEAPANVREHHAVAGNPMRFMPGPVVPDDRWRRDMGIGARLVATVVTAPLLGRYGYGLPPGRPAAVPAADGGAGE